MSQGVYVASDLAGLLKRFLAQEAVQIPDVEARLNAYPANSRMPMEDWWGILEQIQSVMQQPALGVKIGASVQPQDSGVMGYMVMYCNTVAEALMHFQRYQGLIHNYSDVEIEGKGDSVKLSWDLERGISTQLSDEVFMSGLITFIQAVTDQGELKPIAIHFNHEVDFDPEEYKKLFGCDVYFGCERVAIEIPLAAMAVPINTRNPHLFSLLEKQAAALVDENDQDEFLKNVQQVLVEGIAQGNPSLNFVAQRLNVSTRTLHRRLEDRGLNFQEMLQRTRKRLSQHYLTDLTLSLNEVGFLLGYSEQSAFNRAFRKWFDITPKKFRDNLHSA